jgi:hypothetical protein
MGSVVSPVVKCRHLVVHDLTDLALKEVADVIKIVPSCEGELKLDAGLLACEIARMDTARLSAVAPRSKSDRLLIARERRGWVGPKQGAVGDDGDHTLFAEVGYGSARVRADTARTGTNVHDALGPVGSRGVEKTSVKLL